MTIQRGFADPTPPSLSLVNAPADPPHFAHPHLPFVDTQTAAFIADPNALLGRGEGRPAIARGGMGTELLAFLASDEAGFITGVTLDVNGGGFMV
jgi:NAD(P)-dependent dehydrogenase (short-subunit alcohol dehydrogenase family)